jgi:hypothetical protein
MAKLSYQNAASFLETIRDMIKHENLLIDQRLTWLFTLQGLLFGAVSFLWDKNLGLLIYIASILGFISCISIGYNLNRGYSAIKDLLLLAHNYKTGLPNNMIFPPTIGSRKKAFEYILPGRILPWVFGVSWIAMLTYRIIIF